jgi:ribosome recycling factor
MNQDLNSIIEATREHMQKTINHFIDSLNKIRSGKATPGMISDVVVDYYGSKTPLSQIANISVPDPKTIIIQPWDKGMIQSIEKTILASNIGFNPQNDGQIIRINVPPLSEERRKQMVKFIHQEGETNKISIRNSRKKANEEIKVAEKNGAPEDESRRAEDKTQELTNKFIKDIEEILIKKEKEIMTV